MSELSSEEVRHLHNLAAADHGRLMILGLESHWVSTKRGRRSSVWVQVGSKRRRVARMFALGLLPSC